MTANAPSPTHPGPIPLAPRDWPAWIGIAILAAMARIPWPLQRMIGVGLGKSLQLLLKSRRNIAERNIELTFPGLTATQRQQLVRDHFTSLGISLFEFGRAWWGSVEPLRHDLEIEGLEILTQAVDQGNGVILVSGHFTTLEVCGRLLTSYLPVAGMYRPYSSPALEYAVKRGRLRYAAAMFTKTEMRPAVKHLKAGGVLWYAPDQDPSRGDSVFVDFFGVPANTLASTHQLARLSGASVICFGHYRTPQGSYRMKLFNAEPPFPTKDPLRDTAVIINAIESMARTVPAQYLWIHRRFKRQPDGRDVYRS